MRQHKNCFYNFYSINIRNNLVYLIFQNPDTESLFRSSLYLRRCNVCVQEFPLNEDPSKNVLNQFSHVIDLLQGEMKKSR